MKRVVKKKDSPILANQWNYSSQSQRSKIRTTLKEEQSNFCAYSEDWFSASTAVDIEHFDPTLKDTSNDNYHNWFAVCHKWNSKKSDKWTKFQPILHPTASDLDARLAYEDGYFFPKNEHDTEVENLIKLLGLNEFSLVSDRKKHIGMLKELKQEYADHDIQTLLSFLYRHPAQLRFRSAIESEFDCKIDLSNATQL